MSALEEDNVTNGLITLFKFDNDLDTFGTSQTVLQDEIDQMSYTGGRFGQTTFRLNAVIPFTSTMKTYQNHSICFWYHDNNVLKDSRILSNIPEQTLTPAFQGIFINRIIDNGKIYLEAGITGTKTVKTRVEITTTDWLYVTVLFTVASKIEIYLNTTKSATKTFTSMTHTANLHIGNWHLGHKSDNTDPIDTTIFLHGFRFYQKILSLAEITTLRNSPRNMASIPSSFGGNVSKIDNDIMQTKVIAHGYMQELKNAMTTKTFFDTSIIEILDSEIQRIMGNSIQYVGDIESENIDKITLFTSIFDIMNTYTTVSNYRARVTTRKEIVLADITGLPSLSTFIHGRGCNIEKINYDDTGIINDIVTTEKGQTYNFDKLYRLNWRDASEYSTVINSIDYVKSINLVLIDNLNRRVVREYTTFNDMTGTIQDPSHNNIYSWEITINGRHAVLSIIQLQPTEIDLNIEYTINFEFQINSERRDIDQTSIDQHGIKAQLVHPDSVNTQNYQEIIKQQFSDNKLKPAFMITVPRILSNLKLHDVVTIQNDITNIRRQEVQIQRIIWKYPDGKTLLYCGRPIYDITSSFKEINTFIKNTLNQQLDSNVVGVTDEEYDDPYDYLLTETERNTQSDST